MTGAVLNAVRAALEGEGLRAVPGYPGSELDPKTPTVCVGVRSQTVSAPGFGGYLGREERGGVMTERYGVKADLTIQLDLYVPPAAPDCQGLFSAVSRALTALPAGVKPRALTRGEPVPDKAVGMLRCPCSMDCTAYFTCAMEEESGVWRDFELRGVLQT